MLDTEIIDEKMIIQSFFVFINDSIERELMKNDDHIHQKVDILNLEFRSFVNLFYIFRYLQNKEFNAV